MNPFPEDVCHLIKEWEKQCTQFAQFVNQNRNKISHKLRGKTKEEQYDTAIELYTAFAFLKTDCKVAYEPNIQSTSKKPDFQISFGPHCFYLEVKRLRRFRPGHGAVKINERTGDETFSIENEKVRKKIGDIIREKIVQTVPRAVNILHIRPYFPDTPNCHDVREAVTSLMRWKKEDPEKFLEHIKQDCICQFDKDWKQLSAIVFSGPQRLEPQVWRNPEALKPINQNIMKKIKQALRAPFRTGS